MNCDTEQTRWDKPCWLDSAKYPRSPDQLNDWQWKWEFVKRHPRFSALIRTVRLWRVPGIRDVIAEKAFRDMACALLDFGASPEVLITNEILSESPFVVGGGTRCRLSSRDELLNDLEQVAGEYADHLLEYSKALVWTLYLNGIIDSGGEELASRYHAFRFDLTAPIASQLERAKEEIKKEQVRNGIGEIRAQLSPESRNNWTRHLRVLDAKEQGATHVDIFLQFADEGLITETFDSQPRAIVSQWHRQATEVMEKVARFL